MRGRDFLDKMELVSPIYVEGADRTPIIRPKQWPKFVVAAACLCLMAWGAWSFTGGFGREPGYAAGPGDSEGPERAQIEVDGMTLEPCPGTLGFDECWVRRSGEPDAAIWLYYTRREDGQYRLVAESWWNAKSAAPYEADLDGDGVKELIFNLNYEDGFREIQIIRHGDGEIQNWYFNNEFLRDHWEEQGLTVLDGATEHIRSYYDPDRGIVLEADCHDATGKEVLSVEVFHDLEHFKYFTDERHTYADEIGEPNPQPTDEIGMLIIEECPPTLGFDECWVAHKKEASGVHSGYFYARMDDGTIRCIAKACSCFDDLDVYRVDLDGDGIEELICNNTFGDGVEDASIYRNYGTGTDPYNLSAYGIDNIGIEVGWLAPGFWDLYGFETMGAASARTVRYDPERGVVATGYDLEGKPKEEIVQEDFIRFGSYEPPFDAPEIMACIAPEHCPATLGFENCVMTWEEEQGVTTWRFYAQEDGQYRFIAETWNDRNEPDVYRVDLDGDGVDELICNRSFSDGEQGIIVYRNRDGQIERGWLNTSGQFDEWVKEGLDAINGVDAYTVHYDPEQGFVLNAHFRDKNGEDVLKTATFQGLEHVVFGQYGPESAAIPLGVATVKTDN